MSYMPPLGHTHINDYITKDLQPTDDDGDVEYSFDANCGKNLLDEIAAWPMGLHTAYSNGSVSGNPKKILKAGDYLYIRPLTRLDGF